MTVNILGTEWKLAFRSHTEDSYLSDTRCGYTDWSIRTMVIRNDYEGDSAPNDTDAFIRKVTRHEIVHAFLMSAGLTENTLSVDAWADNEEMVDWIAFMGERIYKAWEEAGCLECTK